MSATGIILLVVVSLLAPVLVSYVVEALRGEPAEPEQLAWAREIPVRHAQISGVRIRYITAGQGPALVLLHTLRTQLDIFQKILPELSRYFTVYALDYPGHGYSDIPRAQYTPKLFVDTVAGFLENMAIRDATVVGVSIGASIALLMAARSNTRVSRVVAINPYDYARGTGMARSSPAAKLIVLSSKVPVLGGTVMRLRNRLVERQIFEGGVADPAALPPELVEEMFLVGTRKGHYRAFLNLLGHAAEWEHGRLEYPRISVPVLLIYGDRDWTTVEERDATRKLIPRVRVETVDEGGHFLPLDRPLDVVRLVREFGQLQPE